MGEEALHPRVEKQHVNAKTRLPSRYRFRKLARLFLCSAWGRALCPPSSLRIFLAWPSPPQRHECRQVSHGKPWPMDDKHLGTHLQLSLQGASAAFVRHALTTDKTLYSARSQVVSRQPRPVPLSFVRRGGQVYIGESVWGWTWPLDRPSQTICFPLVQQRLFPRTNVPTTTCSPPAAGRAAPRRQQERHGLTVSTAAQYRFCTAENSQKCARDDIQSPARATSALGFVPSQVASGGKKVHGSKSPVGCASVTIMQFPSFNVLVKAEKARFSVLLCLPHTTPSG